MRLITFHFQHNGKPFKLNTDLISAVYPGTDAQGGTHISFTVEDSFHVSETYNETINLIEDARLMHQSSPKSTHTVVWVKMPDGEVKNFRWANELVDIYKENYIAAGATILPDPFVKGAEPRQSTHSLSRSYSNA